MSARLCLIAAPAAAQLIEVDRSFAWSPDPPNRHLLSLPDPTQVPDIANSGERDACDLSSVTPDGVVNADDIICMIWGGGDDAQRHGALLLQRYDSLECRFVTRTAFRPTPGSPLYFIGTPFDYDRNEGYVGRTWQPATEDCP